MTRRGRTFWTELVQQYERSGLSQAAFAQQHGVSPKTLQGWIRRLREQAPPPGWVPVRLVAPAASPPPGSAPMPPLEVVLPQGLLLRFAAGTDSTYLAQVVARLREGAC